MLTVQKYAGKGSYAKAPEQTAQNAAQTPSTVDERQPCSIPAHLLDDENNWELAEAVRVAQQPTTTGVDPTFVLAAIETAYRLGKDEEDDELLISPSNMVQAIPVEEFITQNADLLGSYPSCLATSLTRRLRAQPVRYTNALDAIALFRSFVPADYADTTYALLLNGFSIVGLVWLPADAQKVNRLGSLVSANDNQGLIRAAIDAKADKIVLATTTDQNECWFTGEELNEISTFYWDAFDFFDVEFLDWLLLTPSNNDSYVLAHLGDQMSNDVTYDELTEHYTDFWRLRTFNPAY